MAEPEASEGEATPPLPEGRWCCTSGATLTFSMPTDRLRHTFTETPPVERALRPLRTLLHNRRIDFKELVILGAQEKAARLERENGDVEQSRRELVEEFLAMRDGDGVDAKVALAIHERGWAADASDL